MFTDSPEDLLLTPMPDKRESWLFLAQASACAFFVQGKDSWLLHCEEIIMDTFWAESWKSIDPKRIAEYVKSMDMAPDDMILILRQHQAKTVCDAGCGCGIYCAKLLRNGFSVFGFDVSEDAVQIAKRNAPEAELKTADIRMTGYDSDSFDAVISRDVLDHMTKENAQLALRELYRIVKPGGIAIFTLDFPDEEYGKEPHEKNADGDFVYTSGKWAGMVFHPYTYEEIKQILPKKAKYTIVQNNDHFFVTLRKQEK